MYSIERMTLKSAERTNAATLVCAYLVIHRGWTPEDAVAPLTFSGKQVPCIAP